MLLVVHITANGLNLLLVCCHPTSGCMAQIIIISKSKLNNYPPLALKHFLWVDSESVCSDLTVSPDSVWRRPAHHLRGPGCDADGPAGSALPGALHSPHQPGGGAVAQGVASVLDWEWICGEYQFDMTAGEPCKRPPKKYS